MGSGQVAGTPILFFHGFWGQPSDWNFLKGKLKKPFWAVPYMTEERLNSGNYLSDWGPNFLSWKSEHFGTSQIQAVGYSQGSRLLLQALAYAPDIFETLVLISTHPGLTDFEEKERRLEQDRYWAQKFRTQDWTSLQEEWSSQGVFHGGAQLHRLEKEYSREDLALCFENWSLAHQQDFRSLIKERLPKISIILGEQDKKYVQLYQNFLNSDNILKMAKGAAHRVPFDQPLMLVETLNSIFS